MMAPSEFVKGFNNKTMNNRKAIYKKKIRTRNPRMKQKMSMKKRLVMKKRKKDIIDTVL